MDIDIRSALGGSAAGAWDADAGAAPDPLFFLAGGPGQGAHLQLHQALGGEANHVAQNICVGGLVDEGAQVHHVVGHRRILGCVCVHNPA